MSKEKSQEIIYHSSFASRKHVNWLLLLLRKLIEEIQLEMFHKLIGQWFRCCSRYL